MLLLLAAACATDPADSGGGEGDDTIVVVTFNTGTTEGLDHDGDDDGYDADDAAISDTWYGDGLAWLPAVEAARSFFAATQPDLVAFQEIFYAGDCVSIPEEAHAGFFCAGWAEGDAIVTEAILGEGYQVACHLGKPDKCAAVRRDFGSFRGCDEHFCLEGLDGGEVEGCGSGSRVGRGTVDRADGGVLNFVNVHGSSGTSSDDEACRLAQIDQVFGDLGDGRPAADGAGVGAPNLVVGDFNTDPGRWTDIDPSAARWVEEVGGDAPFQWISDVGPEAAPTYQGLANIDHVVADQHEGSCWAAGVSDGHPAVLDAIYFDHVPVVCAVAEH